jgi:hypothetical protein
VRSKPRPKFIPSLKARVFFWKKDKFGTIGSTFILDPVEGFLVDGQGRRLGYTTATGAVTEIPNSYWLGDKDGFGFIEGLAQGSFTMQLTGVGGNYYVSALLETDAGPAGIEAEGTLAAGEQKLSTFPSTTLQPLTLTVLLTVSTPPLT